MLSDDDRRLLTQIGNQLQDDDPHLARLLGSHGHDHRRAAVTICAVSLATLFLGGIIAAPLVCAAAWLGVLIGATLWMVATTSVPH